MLRFPLRHHPCALILRETLQLYLIQLLQSFQLSRQLVVELEEGTRKTMVSHSTRIQTQEPSINRVYAMITSKFLLTPMNAVGVNAKLNI